MGVKSVKRSALWSSEYGTGSPTHDTLAGRECGNASALGKPDRKVVASQRTPRVAAVLETATWQGRKPSRG
jgi:hypothetical protein